MPPVEPPPARRLLPQLLKAEFPLRGHRVITSSHPGADAPLRRWGALTRPHALAGPPAATPSRSLAARRPHLHDGPAREAVGTGTRPAEWARVRGGALRPPGKLRVFCGAHSGLSTTPGCQQHSVRPGPCSTGNAIPGGHGFSTQEETPVDASSLTKQPPHSFNNAFLCIPF